MHRQVTVRLDHLELADPILVALDVLEYVGEEFRVILAPGGAENDVVAPGADVKPDPPVNLPARAYDPIPD